MEQYEQKAVKFATKKVEQHTKDKDFDKRGKISTDWASMLKDDSIKLESKDTIKDSTVIINGENVDVKVKYIYYRYKNLMMSYYWIVNNFIPSCKFYVKCATGYNRIDVDTTVSLPEEYELVTELNTLRKQREVLSRLLSVINKIDNNSIINIVLLA